MISPIKSTSNPPPTPVSRFSNHDMGRQRSGSSSSSDIMEDSPTPAFGVAMATARLNLMDDDSPVKAIPGQSRSPLKTGGKDAFSGLDDRGVFLSTQKPSRTSPSPLKFSTTNVYAGRNAPEDEDDEMQLPLTPLMANCPIPPPPQPLFPPLRTSQSQDCNAERKMSASSIFGAKVLDSSRKDDAKPFRLSNSQPIRPRSNTDAQRTLLNSKKAISLDAIATSNSDDVDEAFGSHPAPTFLGKKSRPPSLSNLNGKASSGRAHKRHNSGEQHSLSSLSSISRSTGQKSGLTLSSTPSTIAHDFSSNSSISSLASTSTPSTTFSPAEPPIYESVKPLAEAFENPNATVSVKFKPRDSGIGVDDDDLPSAKPIPPPSVMRPSAGMARPRRPALLKRTSSMGDERQTCETPSVAGPSNASGWPATNAFDFLGDAKLALALNKGERKQSMPDTPVKKHAFGHTRGGSRGGSLGGQPPLSSFRPHVGHSASQPTLAAPQEEPSAGEASNAAAQYLIPPPSVRKPTNAVPSVVLTSTSSPGSPDAIRLDHASPTVRIAPAAGDMDAEATPSAGPSSAAGFLRVQTGFMPSSDGSEEAEEGTPTKGGDWTSLTCE